MDGRGGKEGDLITDRFPSYRCCLRTAEGDDNNNAIANGGFSGGGENLLPPPPSPDVRNGNGRQTRKGEGIYIFSSPVTSGARSDTRIIVTSPEEEEEDRGGGVAVIRTGDGWCHLTPAFSNYMGGGGEGR